MNARRDGNSGYWMGAIAVIFILVVFYWWSDDLGRWISGTPSVETDQTYSPQVDQPEVVEAPEVKEPETPVSPPAAANFPANTD